MQKISKSTINRLKPGEIIAFADPTGFVARRLPSGKVTYGYRYRENDSGRQRWIGLGVNLAPDAARRAALKVASQISDGKKPQSAAKTKAEDRVTLGRTVDKLLDDFVARHVQPNLRSADEVERCFDVYVRPKLGSKTIPDLRRTDIVGLLDDIEDHNGPVMADRVLAHLRKAFNWEVSRTNDFVSPITKGMVRTSWKERARTRTLDDQEIRDLFTALDQLNLGKDAPACYPVFIKAALMSAQRREELSRMHSDEIDGNDWIIPRTRYKAKIDHTVPITDDFAKLIDLSEKTGFLFSSDDGRTPFSGFSKAKAALDAKIAEVRKAAGRKPMQAWVHHDLRRTSRTLLSRSGVSADHAERLLGHILPGLRATYDKHLYRSEKLAALQKLQAALASIVHPGRKVVKFPKSATK